MNAFGAACGPGGTLQGDVERLVRRLCGPSAAGEESETRGLLRCLGLERHSAALEREELATVAALAALSPAQLAAAGVASVGARTALLDAARGLCALAAAARTGAAKR